MTTQERADNLFKYVTGEKVKGKLESLIKEYNENKQDPSKLLDIKDEFNSLSFHISEILAKAKEIQSMAELDVQNSFQEHYEALRCDVNEATGNRYSGEDAKYKARFLNSEAILTHIFAERGFGYIMGYYQTCKAYRDNILQRVSLLKEELFSSRQDV
jgi:hypothetical protein